MNKLFLSLVVFLIAEMSFAQETKIEANRFIKLKNGKVGVTDSLNKTIVPFQYESIEFYNNRLLVRKNGMYGLNTIYNDTILQAIYKYILPRNNNRFILCKTNTLFGLCDNDGKMMLPLIYKNIYSTENDDFYITQNDKNLKGVYNASGENILPEIYQFYTQDGYKIFAVKNGQPLILNFKNPTAELLLDKKIAFVETIRHFTIAEQFFQIVKQDNKYGVINANNEIVIPIIYDDLKSSQHWRYFVITVNGKLGIINVAGNIEKEPIYDDIEFRKEHVLLKRKNQKAEIYFYN
jgi:hypothetical protein